MATRVAAILGTKVYYRASGQTTRNMNIYIYIHTIHTRIEVPLVEASSDGIDRRDLFNKGAVSPDKRSCSKSGPCKGGGGWGHQYSVVTLEKGYRRGGNGGVHSKKRVHSVTPTKCPTATAFPKTCKFHSKELMVYLSRVHPGSAGASY